MMMDVDVGGSDEGSDFDSESEPAPKKTTTRGKKAAVAPAKKAPAKKAPAKKGKKSAAVSSRMTNRYIYV
jgi:double-strand break repair protein MRE11